MRNSFTMQNVKNTMIDTLLAVVAPHLCSGCGKIGTLLCDHCKCNIISQPFQGCVLCQRPSETGICLSHRTAYIQTWIVGIRQGVVQRLIGGFKFQNIKATAPVLAGLLDERLPPLARDTIVIPVPTASSRIRERGYDHTLLIGRHFASRRQLPLDTHSVQRRHTKMQHSASRAARLVQATSAFRLEGPVSSTAPYLILDDIVTTGASIGAIAQLLAQKGATRIYVAALARQPLD